jgi:hypothetical protein
VPALIRFFVELCLLRRAPQDLPASVFLFWLTLATDVSTGVVMALVTALSPWLGLVQAAIEVSLLLGLLYAGLSLTGHLPRFTQSATALLGSGTVIGVVAILALSLNPLGTEETNAATLGAVLLLALVVWSVVVTGHIVRHTFSLTFSQGLGLAIGFEFVVIGVIGALFGG